MISRRDFTRTVGLGTVALGIAPGSIFARQSTSPVPQVKDPKYRTWSEDALREARRLGCTYADIRFTFNRSNGVAVRNGQITSSGSIGFGQFGDEETFGFGVRVIHSGVWGFASSPVVTPEEIRRIVGMATEVARASAMAKKFDVRLAPVKAYDTFWQTPIKVDPWNIPLEDKVGELVAITEIMQKADGVFMATAAVNVNYEWKFLATTEGSFIEQVFYYTAASMTATARRDGQVKSRSYNPGTETRGWEFFTEKNMRGHAERVAAEAVEHAMAKPVGTGLKDLILMPSHSALTIHEIVAHPTELDRIAGYEANYAGTSFITLKDLGRLRYGSKLMNVYADRTHPGGASTVGYDDDGVEAQRWPLVREGVLVGLQTNRETAHYIGETSSRGCTFANHWRNYPFLRMPNVQMEAGPAGSPTVDQMIADVKDGVLVDGQGSFSIDQQRYNGQFAGDAFWEIKDGRKTRMVTDFTYNAITTDFFANLDAVGPPESWEHHGMGGDAKGQPVQSNRPSHGSSPMLLRRIMVGTAQRQPQAPSPKPQAPSPKPQDLRDPMAYSRDEVKAITDKVLNMCKADAVEVEFSGGERSATRFANSSITANLIEHDQEVQITVYYGKKTATASTHQFDDASLKRTIESVQTLAQRKPENPEVMPLVKPPQAYIEVDAALPSAVSFGPAERAQMVKISTDICEKKGVLGAGYIPKFDWVEATANSEGLFTYFHYADASFILTCRTPDQTGSGWAGTTGVKDIKNIDAEMLTNVAADKALKSAKPRAIEPGNYTVILEPRPAARYLSLMLGSLNARAAEEGRSFMSGKERGTTRLGEKVFGDNFTLRSEIGNPILRQSPIGQDGLPAKSVTWVEKGVVKNLFYDRYWAQRQKKEATGTSPQMSLVMEGGTATVEEMIKSTKRGLLVSFFWYIRPVDQMTLLNTGMTRDGLFLIENGEIVGPVQNFRWNESPAVSFNNISMLGRPVPMHTGEAYDNPGTALVPPMKLEDFTMTSISPAV